MIVILSIISIFIFEILNFLRITSEIFSQKNTIKRRIIAGRINLIINEIYHNIESHTRVTLSFKLVGLTQTN